MLHLFVCIALPAFIRWHLPAWMHLLLDTQLSTSDGWEQFCMLDGGSHDRKRPELPGLHEMHERNPEARSSKLV